LAGSRVHTDEKAVQRRGVVGAVVEKRRRGSRCLVDEEDVEEEVDLIEEGDMSGWKLGGLLSTSEGVKVVVDGPLGLLMGKLRRGEKKVGFIDLCLRERTERKKMDLVLTVGF